MKMSNIKKLAAISAVALGAALFSNNAQAVLLDSGGFVNIGASTVVNNNIDVTITHPMHFGSFATTKDPGGVLTATATLSTAGVFTGSVNGGAKVHDAALGDHQAAQITIVAFDTTTLYADYGNVVDPVNGAQHFTLTSVTDDLGGGLTTGTLGTNGSWVSGVNTEGSATTVGTAMVFEIGGVLTTVGATNYATNLYTGSFDLTMSY